MLPRPSQWLSKLVGILFDYLWKKTYKEIKDNPDPHIVILNKYCKKIENSAARGILLDSIKVTEVDEGGFVKNCQWAAKEYLDKGLEGLVDEIDKVEPSTDYAKKIALIRLFRRVTGPRADIHTLKRLLNNKDCIIHGAIITSLTLDQLRNTKKSEKRELIPQLINIIKNDKPMELLLDCRRKAIELLGDISNNDDVEVIKVLQEIEKYDLDVNHGGSNKRNFVGWGRKEARNALEKINEKKRK